MCSEIAPVTYRPGKPQVSTRDIAATLTAPDVVGSLRALLGDTQGTITQVQGNNAVWHKLCDPPK